MKITIEEIKDYLNFRLQMVPDVEMEVRGDAVFAHYYLGYGTQLKPSKFFLIFRTNFDVEWIFFFGHLDETFYVNKLIKQFNSEKKTLEAGIIDTKQLAFGAKKFANSLEEVDEFYDNCYKESKYLYENQIAKQLIDLAGRTTY